MKEQFLCREGTNIIIEYIKKLKGRVDVIDRDVTKIKDNPGTGGSFDGKQIDVEEIKKAFRRETVLRDY